VKTSVLGTLSKDSFRDQEVSFFLRLLLYHFTVIDFATSRFYFTTIFAFHTFVAREEELAGEVSEFGAALLLANPHYLSFLLHTFKEVDTKYEGKERKGNREKKKREEKRQYHQRKSYSPQPHTLSTYSSFTFPHTQIFLHFLSRGESTIYYPINDTS
jgi:hypothetical protein